MGERERARNRSRGAWLIAGVLVSGRAGADVVQLDGTPLPQPVTSAEINLSSALGWDAENLLWRDFEGNALDPPRPYSDFFPDFVTGDAVTLEGLFKWRRDPVDPVAHATTGPGVFMPGCEVSVELLLKGASCSLALGWYNVLDSSDPTPPDPGAIYELLPADTETHLSCTDQSGELRTTGSGFCPLGWDNHHPFNPPELAWVPRRESTGPLAADPRYLGGGIAFALVGDPSTQCSETKHSVGLHNAHSASGEPWLTVLVYPSLIEDESFYLAFEDLPMSAQDWRLPGPGALGTNDGDFNDFVFHVSGVKCAGGGSPCSTGQHGVCSSGRTSCADADGVSTCVALERPAAERCDLLDNDCNGRIDDGAELCGAGAVCEMGVCVEDCSAGARACPSGQECLASGACGDPLCAGVACLPGLVCRGGTCVDACAHVVCPAGTRCELGACVDPCQGVTCGTDQLCDMGVCAASCQCRPCPEGLACQSDGRCEDPACAAVTCPAGERCVEGVCVDPCAGVVCPGGGECIDGICIDPSSGGTGGGSGVTNGGAPGTAASSPGQAGAASGASAGGTSAGGAAAGGASAAGASAAGGSAGGGSAGEGDPSPVGGSRGGAAAAPATAGQAGAVERSPAAGASDDGGCGCSTQRHRFGGAGLGSIATLMALLIRRRPGVRASQDSPSRGKAGCRRPPPSPSGPCRLPSASPGSSTGSGRTTPNPPRATRAASWRCPASST